MSTAEFLAARKSTPIVQAESPEAIWAPALRLAAVAQAERLVGMSVAFASRWFLSAADLGIYSGLRMLLDNTNRSSLGVALGAIQNSIALRARQRPDESERVLAVAATTNTLTSSIYGGSIALWGIFALFASGDPRWGIGMAIVGLLAILKRQQDFRIAVLRSDSDFSAVARIQLVRNLAFGICATAGIVVFGFWGLVGALGLSFLFERSLLNRTDRSKSFPIVWDRRTSISLAMTGLPILAANSAWACVTTLDRALILSNLDDGTKLAGYYSIAVLGCGILEDFGSRVALVLSTSYRSAFSRDGSIESILAQAEATGLSLLGLMVPAGFGLAICGTAALPLVFPRLAPGTDALTPLIPGTIALCAAMPLREAFISADRPWIPTTVTAMGSVALLLRISNLGPNASMPEVAFEASVCRVATSLLLFFLTVALTKWNRARALQWIAASFWCFAWYAASVMIPVDRRDIAIYTSIVIMTVSTLVVTWMFRKMRRQEISGQSEGRNA